VENEVNKENGARQENLESKVKSAKLVPVVGMEVKEPREVKELQVRKDQEVHQEHVVCKAYQVLMDP